MKTTMQSIADALNVSKVTVHKALNNQSGVSESLRAQILEAAQKSGYKFCGDKTMHGKRFLFVVNKKWFNTINEQYYTSIFNLLSARLNQINSALIPVQFELSKTPELLDELNEQLKTPTDGIFSLSEHPIELLDFYSDLKVPALIIDYYSPIRNLNYLYVDNYFNSYLMTCYLINKGCKKIYFIGNIKQSAAVLDRFFGFRKAMLEHNLYYDKRYHINLTVDNQHTYNFTKQDAPQAFLCHCDSSAHCMYQKLIIEKIRVPQDILIAGFDNTQLCEQISPTLTSMGMPINEYADLAYDMMINILKNPTQRFVQKLPMTIHERQSTKKHPPPANSFV